MAHDQNAEAGTHAKKNEAVFVLRMVGVIESDRVFIEKDGLGFFK